MIAAIAVYADVPQKNKENEQQRRRDGNGQRFPVSVVGACFILKYTGKCGKINKNRAGERKGRIILGKLVNLVKDIERFVPFNEQEEKDKTEILSYLSDEKDILTRKNKNAHITVSAWIIDNIHKNVLMAYHNIYDSWAWLGGHADGNENLKEVILKEIEEESGISNAKFLKDDIFSLEILPVSGHEKKGEYISSHLHLNITYLLEADKNCKIRVKEDENSKIGWIDVKEIGRKSTEQWFIDRIYSKLCKKVEDCNFHDL